MLQVHGLRKEFKDVVAVDDASFSVKEGAVCGFVGPNGAGKTTTMRLIATLGMPTRGEVYVEGVSIFEKPYQVRRKIGFMPDHFGVYPDMTVTDYVEFYARAYNVSPAVRASRIEHVMDFTELSKMGGKMVEALSKGMRQKLNLARALINDPRLLILDEPAAGLDPRARVELRYLIRKLADLGKTVFISSHILTELSEICDEMIIIEKGTIVKGGSIDSIKKDVRKQTVVRVRLLNGEKLDQAKKLLATLPNVESITTTVKGELTFHRIDGEETVPDVLKALVNAGFPVVEFRVEEETMEDLFMELTRGEVQ